MPWTLRTIRVSRDLSTARFGTGVLLPTRRTSTDIYPGERVLRIDRDANLKLGHCRSVLVGTVPDGGGLVWPIEP